MNHFPSNVKFISTKDILMEEKALETLIILI
jgi:hypothetical protein